MCYFDAFTYYTIFAIVMKKYEVFMILYVILVGAMIVSVLFQFS